MGPSLKTESRDASISNITVRNDQFKKKAAEVNDYSIVNDCCVQKEMYIS